MSIGRFGSAPIALRGGAQSEQLVQLTLDDINSSMGSAFDVQDGSAVYYENYAYSKALSTLFAANDRFANNIQPGSSYQLLERWEGILGIIPLPDDTISHRQEILSLYFKRFSLPPTLDNLAYFTKALLGNIFIDFELNNSSQPGVSFMPSGTTPPTNTQVPGGELILNGDWRSFISYIGVRIWQPRDKYGNSLIDDALFKSLYKSFYKFYSDYLPAWASFTYKQFNIVGNGAIYGYLGSTTIKGIGTNFTSITGPYGTSNIEVVDDFGNVQTLNVLSIQSDTLLTLTSPLQTPVTDNIGWRYLPQSGFILDTLNNLDNELFAH